jgi:transcriptional regulator with GAF, ATPase, and Fis domain
MSLPPGQRPPDGFWGIIGKSPAIRRVVELIRKLARVMTNAFIGGESGVGKELVARAIHLEGPREDAPFVAVNCAAFPESLLEAELFGVAKGAGTGTEARPGVFERAKGGTVLLDEIGDASPAVQTRLLRVIQERRLVRVGGTEEIEVDVRVITASNKDLVAEVEAGRFRQDLFYRLVVVPVDVPSLRERREDISLLAEYFVRKHCEANSRSLMTIADEAMDVLVNYDWPGNVRQLSNIIERVVVLADSAVVNAADIRQALSRQPKQQSQTPPIAAERHVRGRVPTRNALLAALKEADWSTRDAAAKFGVDPHTIRNWMRKRGIAGPDDEEPN